MSTNQSMTLDERIAATRQERDKYRDASLAYIESDAFDPAHVSLDEKRAIELDKEVVRLVQMQDMRDAASILDRQISAAERGIAHPGFPAAEDDAFAKFTASLAAREAGKFTVQERSMTTANSGVRAEVVSSTVSDPTYLHARAGIKFQPATSGKISGPYFKALDPKAATAEGGTKPAMPDPDLKETPVGAFARTATLTEQVVQFSVGLGVVGQQLAREVTSDINAHAVGAFVTEAGTPLTAGTSPAASLDAALATVEAATNARAALIVVNPADYATVMGKTPASAADVASSASAFSGVPIAVSNAATVGTAIVVASGAWTAFGSQMQLVSQPNLTDNTVTARAEAFYAIVPHFQGAAVAVDLA